MEKELFNELMFQQYEFYEDTAYLHGTYKDFKYEVDFDAGNCSLSVVAYHKETLDDVIFTENQIDELFSLLENNLRNHYKELEDWEDQDRHEQYLWNHR